MEKANNFKSSWKKIDKVIHEMKSALTLAYHAETQLAKARMKMGKAIDTIYGSINAMMNKKEE